MKFVMHHVNVPFVYLMRYFFRIYLTGRLDSSLYVFYNVLMFLLMLSFLFILFILLTLFVLLTFYLCTYVWALKYSFLSFYSLYSFYLTGQWFIAVGNVFIFHLCTYDFFFFFKYNVGWVTEDHKFGSFYVARLLDNKVIFYSILF